MTVHPMPISAEGRTLPARDLGDEDVFPARTLLQVAATSCVIATSLTIAVLRNWSGRLDQTLFDLVHVGTRWTPGTAPEWWNEAVRDITALGGTVVLTGAVVASCAYLLAANRYRLCTLLLGSAVSATVFSMFAKMAVARVRPLNAEHLVVTTTASFPSGHALLSAAIILTIGGLIAFAASKPMERKIIMVTALIVTGCVGLSRIWLGVHWPSDVLAGWMFGTAWASITLWLAKRIDWQGASSPSAAE